MADEDVWLFREAENFGRKDRCILEQALALVDLPARFVRGERDGVLEKLKISATHLNRLRAIAGVPMSIWEAIPGAQSTTRREAERVVDAYRSDPGGVTSRAARIPAGKARPDAIRWLCTGSLRDERSETALPPFEIRRKGAVISLSLRQGSEEDAAALEDELRRWLESKGLQQSESPE